MRNVFKSNLAERKLKITGAKREKGGVTRRRKQRKRNGFRTQREANKEKKNQLRMAREQGAMCMRQCGVHDDVTVGCHGNDAKGG